MSVQLLRKCCCGGGPTSCDCPPGLLGSYLLTAHLRHRNPADDSIIFDCDLSVPVVRVEATPEVCGWVGQDVECAQEGFGRFSGQVGVGLYDPNEDDEDPTCEWVASFDYFSMAALMSIGVGGPTGAYPDITEFPTNSGLWFSYEITDITVT